MVPADDAGVVTDPDGRWGFSHPTTKDQPVTVAEVSIPDHLRAGDVMVIMLKSMKHGGTNLVYLEFNEDKRSDDGEVYPLHALGPPKTVQS